MLNDMRPLGPSADRDLSLPLRYQHILSCGIENIPSHCESLFVPSTEVIPTRSTTRANLRSLDKRDFAFATISEMRHTIERICIL